MLRDLMVIEPHHSVPPLGFVLPHYYVGHPDKMMVLKTMAVSTKRRKIVTGKVKIIKMTWDDDGFY